LRNPGTRLAAAPDLSCAGQRRRVCRPNPAIGSGGGDPLLASPEPSRRERSMFVPLPAEDGDGRLAAADRKRPLTAAA